MITMAVLLIPISAVADVLLLKLQLCIMHFFVTVLAHQNGITITMILIKVVAHVCLRRLS